VKRDAHSIPAASTRLRFDIYGEVKYVAPKPLGEGGQSIFVGHFDPLRSRDSAARATSRQAMNQTTRPNLYESQVCRAEANKRRWMKFYYVYILQSESDQKRFYTGFTEDLESRLKLHNSGGSYHTSK
jgi:hypothetical protein